ncbi:FAD-dependent oxidoreductase [Akkermansiaceae bacterium]|nr:FAD-dependent oxidoreductase [Akkermansiaceae bacterium]
MPKDVLIVGGGVVGLSTAHYLVSAGHSVRIIERDISLANSCSEGNAGMVVPSHFIPLAAPGVISQGLKWMLNPKSPFFLRPRLSPTLARWIWLFTKHSTKKHVENTQELLRDLSLESRRLHVELSRNEGFPLIQKGLLMLCQSDTGLEEEAEVAEHAHTLGLDAEVCDQTRLQELEPNAEITAKGGVWWPQDCHLSPGDFIESLRDSILKNRGEFISGEVTKLEAANGRVNRVITETGETYSAELIVLAGGINTTELAKQVGLALPMQGGKGYSLTLPEPVANPRLCSLLKEGRVAVTPMGDTLRVAGTMEICGTDTSVSKPRLQGVIEAFCKFYPQYSPSDFKNLEPWVGLRPCSPDGLPYLGFAPHQDNLIIATGHSMMGLSLAPVTGRLVADLVSEKKPAINLTQLAPGRF